jgi:hypothetical protein
MAEAAKVPDKKREKTVRTLAWPIKSLRERQEQNGEKQKDYYLDERRFGSFERRFQVREGTDTDNAKPQYPLPVCSGSRPYWIGAERRAALKRHIVSHIINLFELIEGCVCGTLGSHSLRSVLKLASYKLL